MYSSTHEYEAQVLVNGKPVTEVQHNGQTFIEGRSGSIYELKFRNKTSRRVKIIPSVDGLNVLDGKTCGVDSPGYIVDAHDSVTIPGWKVDGRTAAKFKFNTQGDGKTYAEAQGVSQENQGTLGFMVFPEKQRSIWDEWPQPQPYTPRRSNPYWGTPLRGSGAAGDPNEGKEWLTSNSVVRGLGSIQCSATSAKGMSASHETLDSHFSDEEAGLGTGWGKATEFKTQKVDFECENAKSPSVVLVFYYNTLKNLKRVGIPVEKFRRNYQESSSTGPNPFPASPGVMGSGCTPPPGWKR